MLFFPNCKINFGLKITGKRADGYHNIETVFFPVPLKDAIEIIDNTTSLKTVEFSQSGIALDGLQNDNLCIKAWELLKNDFPTLPSIKLHLHKAIPSGAGLGGGSADGSFTLVYLNQKYSLNLSENQLLAYALQLGSDCPFFIINSPCLANGRGELLQPIQLSLSGYRLVLVNPGIHVNTRWAFSQLKLTEPSSNYTANFKQSLATIVSGSINHWKNNLTNDFEIPVFEKSPIINSIKQTLYDKGAIYASMSGSGSSVFGIFNDSKMPSLHFPNNFLINNSAL